MAHCFNSFKDLPTEAGKDLIESWDAPCPLFRLKPQASSNLSDCSMKTTCCSPSIMLTSLRRSSLLAVRLLLLCGILITSIPMPADAQIFAPPSRGMPGRREGGGTRGCWGTDAVNASQISLTALVPAQNFGYTLDPYPSFFVYVPEAFAERAVAAEFYLSDAARTVVYHANYQVSDRSGVIRIDLPSHGNLAPLAVGQDYNWSFTLICNPEDPSANLVVESWIQRIEPAVVFQAELETTDPQAVPDLLARQGIWYNTLTSLDGLSASSDRLTQVQRWQTLLNSVGLSQMSQQLTPDSFTTLMPTVPAGQAVSEVLQP